MESARTAAAPSRSLRFVLAAGFLLMVCGPTLIADSPKSPLPSFGNNGAKFTVAAKDGHALHGWLPIGWTDNSDWAAVNATYTKLTDSPDKDAGAVRIKIDDVDDGQLQLTSSAGDQQYKKGRNYVVTGWVRSPDHIRVMVGDRELDEPHAFYDQAYLPTSSEWKPFEFSFTPDMDCNARVMFVVSQPGTVDLAGIAMEEKP